MWSPCRSFHLSLNLTGLGSFGVGMSIYPFGRTGNGLEAMRDEALAFIGRNMGSME